MLHSMKEMEGRPIHATDGDLGEVLDVLFDDRDWGVRYLVVDTGRWLPGRKVLIPTQAVEEGRDLHRHIPVRLDKEQVRHSPDVDAAIPVSREMELKLHHHYGWQPYWTSFLPPKPEDGLPPHQTAYAPERSRDPLHQPTSHLHGLEEITGYRIQASNGTMGHVDDLLWEDENFQVRYLVVDTHHWLPGRKVLVAPAWVKEVDWAASLLHLDLAREQVEKSPPYDPSRPLERDYERELHRHYGFEQYWI